MLRRVNDTKIVHRYAKNNRKIIELFGVKFINDYIIISYHKNGNIKKCTSVYDDKETNKPLNNSKVHSSYVPLLQREIHEFFKNIYALWICRQLKKK